MYRKTEIKMAANLSIKATFLDSLKWLLLTGLTVALTEHRDYFFGYRS